MAPRQREGGQDRPFVLFESVGKGVQGREVALRHSVQPGRACGRRPRADHRHEGLYERIRCRRCRTPLLHLHQGPLFGGCQRLRVLQQQPDKTPTGGSPRRKAIGERAHGAVGDCPPVCVRRRWGGLLTSLAPPVGDHAPRSAEALGLDILPEADAIVAALGPAPFEIGHVGGR